MGVNSISFGSPHVRPMWALSTCGEPNEIKKNTHPKNSTALSRDQAGDGSDSLVMKMHAQLTMICRLLVRGAHQLEPVGTNWNIPKACRRLVQLSCFLAFLLDALSFTARAPHPKREPCVAGGAGFATASTAPCQSTGLCMCIHGTMHAFLVD